MRPAAGGTIGATAGSHAEPRDLSSYERFKIVAVTGGIPSYLERVDPSASSDASQPRYVDAVIDFGELWE
jgi:hypothetical protein